MLMTISLDKTGNRTILRYFILQFSYGLNLFIEIESQIMNGV